jgi:hypothetical protein
MKSLVRPELPTASVGSSQAPTAAVDNAAPLATRPQSTYKSGNAVQTSGATSHCALGTDLGFVQLAFIVTIRGFGMVFSTCFVLAGGLLMGGACRHIGV